MRSPLPADRSDDLLADAPWRCVAVAPGLITDPAELVSAAGPWWPAEVPGTAAGALRSQGDPSLEWRDFDADDWWFTTTVETQGDGPWLLGFDGLATLADVWLDGEQILATDNMFLAHQVEVDRLASPATLAIRFRSLAQALTARRPRPGWKSLRLSHQALRWFRTTLLGRMIGWVPSPPPVGPWRPVTLRPMPALRVMEREVQTVCDSEGPGGTVAVRIRLRRNPPKPLDVLPEAALTVGDHRVELAVEITEDGDAVVSGKASLPSVRRWWPHTHGTPARYPVTLHFGTEQLALGHTGFRTIEVDRSDGGFTLAVNGTPVYCRGACWTPIDPCTLTASPEALADELRRYVAANLNMVRVPGETVYESPAFYEACDELGILVWQDCMFAFADYPEEPGFVASVEAEVRQVFTELQARPCLAVVNGAADTEEQAEFVGLPRDRWQFPLAQDHIRLVAERLLPEVPYVFSSPTGGTLATQPGFGVGHYFGVGAYLRPPTDVRRAHVRFAVECLSLATPPEPETVDRYFGGPAAAGHHWRWKRAVHRDATSSWDLEDVRAYYTGDLFGIDPFKVRYTDPSRALDLARATTAEIYQAVLSEWRRPRSGCWGSLVFHWRDLQPGAGLGIVDSDGRPKASYYLLRRLMAPVVVTVTDEGLNGLTAHLSNDRPEPFEGLLQVELISNGELAVETVAAEVQVPGRGGQEVELAALFDGFRDISYAHRFGPPAHDVVAVSLTAADGGEVSSAAFLSAGACRPVEADLGLEAVATPCSPTAWQLEIGTRRFAQWVAIDVPGFRPSDSWFHILPGRSRTVILEATGDRSRPGGEVRALNCGRPVRVTVLA